MGGTKKSDAQQGVALVRRLVIACQCHSLVAFPSLVIQGVHFKNWVKSVIQTSLSLDNIAIDLPYVPGVHSCRLQ